MSTASAAPANPLEVEKLPAAGLGVKGAGALKILIADDDRINRKILKAMLVQQGFTILQACDGQEAVALFEKEMPDLVLMDVVMPVMEGYEATRLIKQKSGERFVPVIFLTSITDEMELARCVECGGDDFLTKPYSQVILKAKIDALNRVRAIYADLKSKKDELAYHQERIKQEHEIAKKVFANIVHSGCLNQPNVKHLLSPLALFNGDLLLSAAIPSGGFRFLLGDFTGHGLSAAIGAMPVSEIFYDRTGNGFSIGDIAREINQRLKTVLPTGFYFAACLLDVGLAGSTLSVWNGGLPDVLVMKKTGGLRYRLPSRHMPIGILDSGGFDPGIEKLEVSEGDRIYAYSDGVIESRNPNGELYGQERFERILSEASDPGQRFDLFLQDLRGFRSDGKQDDDITLVEIACDPAAVPASYLGLDHRPLPKPPASWRLTLELAAKSLKAIDPLPPLIQALMEIQGLHRFRETLFTVLAELYSNSLEHGILGLDSALKSTPNGFSEYYARREASLQDLVKGWVRLDLEHTPLGDGGKLVIQVEDSGPGFDVKRHQGSLDDHQAHSGRGIALVKTLCQELRYNDKGNAVEAVFIW